MVQYTDELKEEVRSANDIVDVISQYVNLKIFIKDTKLYK